MPNTYVRRMGRVVATILIGASACGSQTTWGQTLPGNILPNGLLPLLSGQAPASAVSTAAYHQPMP